MLVPHQSTLNGGDEAARIDEAHDQLIDFHPAEQGAEATFGVTGRVDRDLHEAVGGTVHQPTAALAVHADRSAVRATTGRPGERRCAARRP
jgi:hypothetical protein